MANSKSKRTKKRLTRADLIKSPEFWEENIKTELFNIIQNFMDDNNLNQTQLAKKIGCSKGYISQIINGESDHRISKLVGLALAVGKAPYLYLKDMEQVLKKDHEHQSVLIDFEELEAKADKCDRLTHYSFSELKHSISMEEISFTNLSDNTEARFEKDEDCKVFKMFADAA